jgi:CIC family chloride channel protein
MLQARLLSKAFLVGDIMQQQERVAAGKIGPSRALRNALGSILDRLPIPPEVIMMGTALAVGILTGIGAVIFRYLIQAVAWVGYEWIPSVFPGEFKAYVIYVPAIGGLFVGLLVYYFAREAKGHGVPEVMEAVALRGGRIRPRVAVVKSLASSLSIGTGGSVGREGPIVQIGSALGSSIGQALHLSDDRISNLVACGAAGGIAATFNAPIAGVVFALEVILGGRFSVRYFSSVVVSSVAASVIGRIAFGDEPAFAIPAEYGVRSLWEFLFYPILGVLAALVGVLFVRVLYGTEDLFDDWKKVPEWVKPAIGGLLLGIIALIYPVVTNVAWDRTPQIYNVGYEVIEGVLANHSALTMVLSLLVLKLIATSLTLGSGGSGGVFAPSLFMGAMLGSAFALVMDSIFPGTPAPPGAYALVGMAAVFAASAHAPITAVLILFELTGDYRIILPLMLTVVVATVLAQRLLKGESIYTMKLTRRGIRLQRGRDIDILQSVTVGEVMSPHTDTVQVDTTINELADVFARTHHHGLLVVDEQDKLWGIVTITDLEENVRQGGSRDITVSDIGTPWPHLKVAYPDESLGDALARMAPRGLGRMPVVSREDPYELLGLIRRQDIITAYDLALTRRANISHLTRQAQSQTKEAMEFVDVHLSAGDPVIGKTVAQLSGDLPTESVLVSITRNRRVVIPHGNTLFEAGDQVTAFIRHRDAHALFRCLHGDRSEEAESQPEEGG